MAKAFEGQNGQVGLVLSRWEAKCLAALLGQVSGTGDVRNAITAVWRALVENGTSSFCNGFIAFESVRSTDYFEAANITAKSSRKENGETD